MSWTDEETERAIDGWNKGKSGGELAAMFKGKSRNAVISKIHRLHDLGDPRIVRSPVQADWSDDALLALMRFVERDGMTFAQIGRILGASATACSRKYNQIVRDLEASDLR